MTTNTKPAVVYIRAIANHSKENQKAFIERQVSGTDFHVVSTFIDTGSGVDDILKRPGLRQLFEALHADPNIHDVIVYDQSRLSRRVSEAQQIVQRLADMNVEVHYAADGLGSNQMEAIMTRFIRMEERRMHGERIRRGKATEAHRTMKSKWWPGSFSGFLGHHMTYVGFPPPDVYFPVPLNTSRYRSRFPYPW